VYRVNNRLTAETSEPSIRRRSTDKYLFKGSSEDQVSDQISERREVDGSHYD